MDVENMHPFCLPFGLCHDATSSTISVTDTLTSNIDPDKQRSRTSSPTDELFTQLNEHSICRSILDHDTIIDSSSLIDDDLAFRSLELDIDQEHETENGDAFEYGTDEFDENPTISNNQSGLISPLSPPGYCQRLKRRKLSTQARTALANNYHLHHHHHHHHHNVFHEIDPIDIKSSPTLAQLNLNSNDDQNDGLWDTTSTRMHPPTNTDLIISSNCTSIHAGSKCTSTSVCSSMHLHGHNHHLHNHNHHGQHHHQPQHNYHLNHSQLYSSSSVNHLGRDSCQHSSNLRPNESSYKLNSNHQSHMQGGCLQPVSPVFRKSSLDLNHPCCNHHVSMINSNHINDNNCNLKDTTPMSHANLLPDSNELIYQGNSQQTFSNMIVEKHQLVINNRTMSQRSASPALVTSSSSPLSTFLNGNNGGNVKDNRVLDNRLKENIDYLTALLCNGNQLECSAPQQPIISSTMVKSYTALAHTLSTGPKLLERQSSIQPQTQLVADNKQQKLADCPKNEVNTCRQNGVSLAGGTQIIVPFEQQQLVGNNQQWSKQQAFVESSVSAADSTESQVTSQTRGSVDEANNNRVLGLNPMSSLPVLNQAKGSHETVNNSQVAQPFKSSLHMNDRRNNPTVLQGDAPNSCLRHQLTASTNTSSASCTAQETSFPQSGKPITLTPIASNNSIIVQQQQHQQHQQQQQHNPTTQRAPLFAQPASPSSTASSGNAEIGSSSLPSSKPNAKAKRPVPANMRRPNTSERSGRPNSLSTECSLSSHDEGFASQMDIEDCNSNKDSDDDDDIDSDDESFYGDYTNNDLIGASISDDPENKWTLNMGRTRRNGQKRFFWQYNVQSKGPKGTRICSSDNPEDPFVLPEASDPVFSSDCQVEGVKHSGKARRGDGNDLTPNPRKLLMIGLELKKLSRVINELAPVTDLPLNARNTTRKEKNKLASRACRLKKKAQHEANKIKLYGLQREHQQVVMAIFDARKLINEKLSQLEDPSKDNNVIDLNSAASIRSQVEMMAKQCSITVAGQTSDYVNSVLEKVVSGCIDGGLQT